MDPKTLADRHRAVLPRWVSPMYGEPMEFASASGRRVVDTEGKSYLDFFGGVLTTSVGYDIPEIREAVERQLSTGVVHTSTLYLIRNQVLLAEKIAAVSGIADAKVFLANSGSEATETALLLATQYRRSNQILAMRNSYHGRTFGAVGVTGNRGWSASSYTPFDVSYLHSGDRLRGLLAGASDAEYTERAIADLREVLDTTTSGDVACLIAEPIQGVGGFVMPPDGYFGAVKEVLDDHGILWISDEVQTGWGRTGEHFWGYQAHGATPDILTFAKGIGNGFALGGVVARAEVMDCLQAVSFNTFGGNPFAAAAGIAVLDYLLDNDLQANAARTGAIIHRGLNEAARRSPIVAQVRGKGLMIAIEFVAAGTRRPDPAAALRVVEACKRDGLLVGKGGLYGNVIRMGPPLSLTEDEAAEGLAILVNAIAEAGR
ncbi:MAG TPA: aspartate aminotransferase family protein [Stackebrandtia sp.]|jgi:4-aminobutyrate aminotransferase|uniref:aspartate aminotransferase family protein n=1 Tax=Stackebrandtia sp. TaxID=2023065 RepID=UPI002D3A5C17|nr:aspartate aminotransferase family protein [Stackebrandtia sp.]HZE38392.1 aspartate aminotransferase family protein [Stackebrandtia sp.]